MKFQVEIDIMPQSALLDPQGKTVEQGLHQIGFSSIENVRVGKHITLSIEAETEEEAVNKVEDACKKVLTNPVMEQYEYQIVPG
jgi:phosphoribosylformylglycinamidine synthase PurS subunit